MQSGMTIGRLAKAAGMNVETIRYYQRRGLLDEPRKPLGGHRRYPAQAVRQLAFIRRAQPLGFSREDVKGLLALAVLESRAAELDKMKRALGRLVDASRRTRGGSDPLVAALFAEDDAT